MITITFLHMNLFVVGQDTIRVLVPNTGHAGTVRHNGSAVSLAKGTLRSTPSQHRPPSKIIAASSHWSSLASVVTSAAGRRPVESAAPLTHYDLTLPKGTLTGEAPVLTAPFDRYADARWEFDPGKTTTLTNKVTYALDADSLDIAAPGTGVLTLRSGDDLTIDNDDYEKPTLTTTGTHVLLPQFEVIYRLMGLTAGPIPRTPIRGTTMESSSPDLPICSAVYIED